MTGFPQRVSLCAVLVADSSHAAQREIGGRGCGRAATQEEAGKLEIEPGSPVLVTKGATRDQEHRVLHVIDVVAAPGRMPQGYRYGAIPTDEESSS